MSKAVDKTCHFCGKAFSRGSNLRRHMESYCPSRSEEHQELDDYHEREVDDNEESMYSDDEISESDDTEDDSDNEEEEDIEDENPWERIKQQAKNSHKEEYEELVDTYTHEGIDKDRAHSKAYQKLLPALQRETREIYLQYLNWIRDLKRDPIHKQIMETKHDFMSNDDFDEEEATEAAVSKRKFLLNRIFTDEDGYETDRNDDEEELSKHVNHMPNE